MAFKFDFDGDVVSKWVRTGSGIEKTVVEGYHPTIYVSAPERAREDLRAWLQPDPRVVSLGTEERFVDLHAQSKTPVLRIDITTMDEVRSLGHAIIKTYEVDRFAPGTYQLYNVDLPPEFRYCLETATPPTPDQELTELHLGIGEKHLAHADISRLRVDGEERALDEEYMVEVVRAEIDRADPDVLVLNRSGLIPLLYHKADAYDIDGFELGRDAGYKHLASENTVESYGQIGHSPARFNIPGRALVDTSNSFMWSHSSLAGILDLVGRSWRPLQETAWASIGTILTSMQIRRAVQRGVLVPWNKWEPEQFKDTRTLHAADRGGFTFAPDVGFHEDIVEIDYASLYPNIICEYNISPETILCSCHPDRTTIPTVEYNVCERSGFLPDVLSPILEDRAALKDAIQTTTNEDTLSAYKSRMNALKWVLVTCFGYLGYRNAKWGRIECHEAINAVARDILLTSKNILEAHGWNIAHGIIDSLWITPILDRDPTPVETVCAELTDAVGIRANHEADYDWVAFVPRRDSNVGALTKYFGKRSDTDEFKIRGIEARQRSTPPWIADAQRDLIRALDRHRTPDAVCDRLQRYLGDLRRGDVDPADLVIKKRVSKRIDAYTQKTLNVAALRRADDRGVSISPGQNVRYVVTNNDGREQGRVQLHFEDLDRYDTDYYAELLVRACESVVSPMGWDRRDIRRAISGIRAVELAAFE